VNVAQHGDTIYVHTGTYKENVVIEKPLSLIGENKHITIIDGNGSEDVIRVTVDDCIISGFTVKNGSTGIYLSSDNNFVNNNNITDIIGAHGNETLLSLNKSGGVGTGVYLFRGANNLISDNSISNIAGGAGGSSNDWLSTDGTGGSGIGIYMRFSANNTLSDNTISGINGGTGGGDYGYNGTGDGIRLYRSNNSVICDSTISSNNQHGIFSEKSSNIDVSNNLLINNGKGGYYGHGVYIGYAANATVSNNTINNNTGRYSSGIKAVTFSNASFTDNIITNNEKDGIFLYLSTEVNISGNIITDLVSILKIILVILVTTTLLTTLSPQIKTMVFI
jgi:parallel beta-helix repeat protein